MKVDIDRQELATILAALRYYQQNGQGRPNNCSDDIHEIATNGDAEISLDDQGIDELCERLNFDASGESFDQQQCPTCEKTFDRSSRAARAGKKFCSERCRHKAYRDRKPLFPKEHDGSPEPARHRLG